MKFVPDEKYNALIQKATHWDNLQAKMTEGMTEAEASAFTPEAALSAMEEAAKAQGDDAVVDLQAQVKTLTTDKEKLTTEKDALNLKVKTLEKQAGSRGATAITETEVTESTAKGVTSEDKSFGENLDAVTTAFKSLLN